jgi:hypothetical protein
MSHPNRKPTRRRNNDTNSGESHSHIGVSSMTDSQLIGLTAPNIVAVSRYRRESDLLFHH